MADDFERKQEPDDEDAENERRLAADLRQAQQLLSAWLQNEIPGQTVLRDQYDAVKARREDAVTNAERELHRVEMERKNREVLAANQRTVEASRRAEARADAALKETIEHNAAVRAHNDKTRRIAMAALVVSLLAAAGTVGNALYNFLRSHP